MTSRKLLWGVLLAGSILGFVASGMCMRTMPPQDDQDASAAAVAAPQVSKTTFLKKIKELPDILRDINCPPKEMAIVWDADGVLFVSEYNIKGQKVRTLCDPELARTYWNVAQKTFRDFLTNHPDFTNKFELSPNDSNLPQTVREKFVDFMEKMNVSHKYALADPDFPRIVEQIRQNGFQQIICSSTQLNSSRREFLKNNYDFEARKINYYHRQDKIKFLQEEYLRGHISLIHGGTEAVPEVRQILLIDDNQDMRLPPNPLIQLLYYSFLGGPIEEEETCRILQETLKKELNAWKQFAETPQQKPASHYVKPPRQTDQKDNKCSIS